VIVAFNTKGGNLLTSNGVSSLGNSQAHFNKSCIYPNYKRLKSSLAVCTGEIL